MAAPESSSTYGVAGGEAASGLPPGQSWNETWPVVHEGDPMSGESAREDERGPRLLLLDVEVGEVLLAYGDRAIRQDPIVLRETGCQLHGTGMAERVCRDCLEILGEAFPELLDLAFAAFMHAGDFAHMSP